MSAQAQKVKSMSENRDWWGQQQVDVPASGARLEFESMELDLLIFQKGNKKRKRRKREKRKRERRKKEE